MFSFNIFSLKILTSTFAPAFEGHCFLEFALLWANKRSCQSFALNLMYMKTVNDFNELIIETKTIQKSKSATLIKKQFFLLDFESIFPKQLPVLV